MVTLETSPLFRDLPAAELSALSRLAQERSIAPGRDIFREGDPGDGVYLLKDGQVEISAAVTPDSRSVLSQVAPGELFGEMAVLETKPRSATATATQPSTVYFIPREPLLELLDHAPSVAFGLLRESSRRLREFDQRHVQDLLQAERLAVVGRFARAIVHDLKNPLNVIGLSAELAAMEKATPQARRTAVENIRKQVGRITEMVGDIMEFTQSTPSQKILGAMNHAEFVRQVVAEIRPEVELRGSQLEVEEPLAAVRLTFDPKRLRRVYYNIIHNATDALLSGGKILIRSFVSGAELVTEIEDNGPGIAPEIAGKLFQAFATFGKAHGTGLGLSICKKIIDDHHGHIWARNEPGRGAVFAIALPVNPS
ncbi:MAG: cyclic nucleotide-binding domain-containing protein [Verrucomicrobiota bacterium]